MTPDQTPLFMVTGCAALPAGHKGGAAIRQLKPVVELIGKAELVSRIVLSSKAGSTNGSPLMFDARTFAKLLEDPLFPARMLIGATGITEITNQSLDLVTKQAAPIELDFEAAKVEARALEFCATNGLLSELTQAIGLARKHFPHDSSIRVYAETDPDDSEHYAVLEVNSAGEPSADLEAYSRYSEEWSSRVAWPASRMILLDLKSMDE